MRVTAHRITDALLGALTGRPGGFGASRVLGALDKNHQYFGWMPMVRA